MKVNDPEIVYYWRRTWPVHIHNIAYGKGGFPLQEWTNMSRANYLNSSKNSNTIKVAIKICLKIK